jgi:hypothetical protein
MDGASLDKGSVSLLFAEWKLEGATWKAGVGYRVASTGDVDLDSHADVAVAARSTGLGHGLARRTSSALGNRRPLDQASFQLGLRQLGF